ncbi:MFS transporter [Streptomyces sp. NPDC059985]|uniref:MFS transporter n=1 Tax=Streptomyces sp. NPDC059985 TaxID=3347025 RepID=UPI00369DE51D
MTALDAPPPALSAPRAGRPTPAAAIITSVVIVELSSGVIQGFLSPLLKNLTTALGITVADLNWISIANLLASAVFTPVLSRLGDLHGHRRILRWNLALVLVGSLLVGLARDFATLLTGQILQGAIAGFFPLLVGILRNRPGAGDAESRRGISVMVAALVAGMTLGLFASGAVAASIDNPTGALWVPAVAVTIAFAVSWPLLPETPAHNAGRVDWVGGLLLCAALVAIMLGLGLGGAPGWAWSSVRLWTLLVGGAAVLAVWIAVEVRVPHPMIDVKMFRRRNVVVVSLVTVTFSFCMFGLQIANPVFYGTTGAEAGYGLGLDPLGIGLAMLPYLVAIALGALLAPAVAIRITDRSTLITGSALMAVGYALSAAAHDFATALIAANALSGIGIGFLQHSTRTLAVEAVPHEQTSVGSGINELLISVGGSLGAAVVLTVSAAHTPVGATLPGLGAYTTSWTLCALVSLLGAGFALLHRNRDNSISPVRDTASDGKEHQ